METLTELINQFNAYAKANPILAGAVSLWGLGIVTWICRGVPTAIWRFCRRQFTITLSFTSDNSGTGLETFSNFMNWFQQTRWARWSRSLSILPSSDGDEIGEGQRKNDGTVVGVGFGNHLFFYHGWPFWLNFNRMTEGGNMHQVTYEVQITALGRSRQRVLDLIDEFRYRPPQNKTGIFRFDCGHWYRVCDVTKRPLNTVVVRRDIKEELLRNLEDWRQARDWYESRGLAYKLTCVLRGVPGTGKTSLIKAIAGHLDMNICTLNLAGMSDSTFEEALSRTRDNSIIVIEDFDSAAATKVRKSMKKQRGFQRGPRREEPNDDNEDSIADLFGSALTLSGILNALDGIIALDGKLIFMTTNVYEDIDPALLRKGRVDYTYELTELTDAEVREYIRVMFPGQTLAFDGVFEDILGCDLQDLYFRHHKDLDAFVNALPRATFQAIVNEK